MAAPEFLRRLLDPWQRRLVLMQDLVCETAHEFFRGRGLIHLNLPITTGAISSPAGPSSDSTPVSIELGGARTFLVDSMQFMLEYGCRLAPGGCFYLMPSFRNESVDASHLQQFFHLEAEVAGDFGEVQSLVEAFIRLLCERVLSHPVLAAEAMHSTSLQRFLERDSVPAISYEEARLRLAEFPDAFDALPDPLPPRIARAGEQRLIELFGGAVWLVRPPAPIVPFYQATDADGYAICGDLLLGFGEVCGGGERHFDARATLAALRSQGVDDRPYSWYLDMKREFPLRTSGFGIGVERLLAWLFERHDVRLFELVPRRIGENLSP